MVRVIALAIGKTLSKVFGLATVTFLGRMPSRDDGRIAFVGLASLVWLLLVAAAIWPAFAEVMIPFAPDDEGLLRGIALAAAILLPLVTGAVVAGMHNNRGRGAMRAFRHVVSGYIYSAVVGLTVLSIIVTVPLVRFRYILRRYTVTRVMVMIPRGCYEGFLDHAVEAIEDAGISVERRVPSRLMRIQLRILGHVLAHVFARQVADDIRVLHGSEEGDRFEITVHAADLSVVGGQRVAHRLRAILADAIDERLVYLTWDDESQELEDRLREVRGMLDAGVKVRRSTLDELVTALSNLHLDQEEWDAVRRVIYRLERDAARLELDTTERSEHPERREHREQP